MDEEFTDWIATLTMPQCRALASQVGISGWMTFPIDKLRDRLSQNANVVDIYEEHYGQ